MGADLDRLRPTWMRMGVHHFCDAVGYRWVDLTPYIGWAEKVERAMSQAGSGRYRSGFKAPRADLVGALGAAVYAIWDGVDPQVIVDRRGDGGADTRDDTQIKASGRWYNPWLIVPRSQRRTAHYALVAVDLGRLAAKNPWPGQYPRGVMVWRISGARMFELAGVNSAYDPERFVDWYGNGIPHYCVNWAQEAPWWAEKDDGAPVQGIIKAPAAEDATRASAPEPEGELFGPGDAVRQMRDLLRG